MGIRPEEVLAQAPERLQGSRGAPPAACENSGFARTPVDVTFTPRVGPDGTCDMDNEQINAIGTALADLSERTQQLRGYL